MHFPQLLAIAFLVAAPSISARSDTADIVKRNPVSSPYALVHPLQRLTRNSMALPILLGRWGSRLLDSLT